MSADDQDHQGLATALRQAMTDYARAIGAPPDRWDEVEARAAVARRRRMLQRGIPVVGLAAAVLAAVVTASALRSGTPQKVATGPGSSPASVPASEPAPAVSTTGTAAASPAAQLPPGYQPLWPFADAAGVKGWQDAYRAGGSQPWHLDADATALAFTTGYLGFGELNVVVRHTVAAGDAHVSVGYKVPNTTPSTAAVVHLVRFGGGTDAPWEVVGTDDTRGLSVTTPAYGAKVSSPVAVGGAITGVDESIDVRVLQQSPSRVLGNRCCLPAGGSDTPWSTTLTFQGASAPVLTIVASTGGHLQTVERFSVTAVRI